MKGAGDVGGTIQVLPPRVKQDHVMRSQGLGRRGDCTVVYDSTVAVHAYKKYMGVGVSVWWMLGWFV